MVVMAGLPDKTYMDLDDLLKAQAGTWAEVLPKLAPVRALAEENRNRVLAVAVHALVQALGLPTSPLVYRPSEFPKQEAEPDPKRVKAALEWLRTESVPSWFVVPAVQPRDVAPIPADLRGFRLGAQLPSAVRYPGALERVMDIMGDDVVELDRDLVVLYVGCCAVSSRVGVPHTNGPTSDFPIYGFGGSADWMRLSPMLGAFPYEAIPRLGGEAGGACTWENATVELNRNVMSEWSYATPVNEIDGTPLPLARYGSPCATETRLDLTHVAANLLRVSVVDQAGVVTAKDGFAGLRAAPYGGI